MKSINEQRQKTCVSKTEGINMTVNHPSVITNCGIPEVRLSNQHTTFNQLVPIFRENKYADPLRVITKL